ncbi:hypothetical protein J2X84_004538 [Pseudomonas corrugata]|uniref:hypothetical protein n=1 Tax=Pseudomonas corrugata TaxID=47879 RepID=UPI002857EDE9|nr:hypothetical protein [Pseudomonas corrugata]MDR7285688.1 hypothetical protein [Pseudomonas corrugata]
MKINLSPTRRDDTLQISRVGSALNINGELFDFSRMVDGDTLPATAIASEWFMGQVDNIGGELELTLFLPLPANFSHEQAFPQPLLHVPDGPVILPQPTPTPVPDIQEVEA